MNRKYTVIAVALAVFLVPAPPARGQSQVKYGGYLSF